MNRTILLACIILVPALCLAQDELPRGPKEVLRRVRSFQVEEDIFYDKGLFPSQRSWFGKKVEDNNVFFSALIVYTLKSLRRKLLDSTLVDSLAAAMQPNFQRYASRRGRTGLYNFWMTEPPEAPFPNSKLLSKSKYRLPDDYDDTALIQLASVDESDDAEARRRMLEYANRPERKPVKKTLRRYRKYKAYEANFADKVPAEYDINVMTNVLLFVFSNSYELDKVDTETIDFIKAAVADDMPFRRPEKLAPYYRSTPIILYHLARVVAHDKLGVFAGIEEQLIEDIQQSLTREKSEMNKLILYSSLFRLGEQPNIVLNREQLSRELETYTWFCFKPFGIYSFLPKMKWRSEAYNWTLYLEFLVLSDGATPQFLPSDK